MRGSIIKREMKKGVVYDIVFDLGRDPVTGRRKQKWQRGYRTRKEAEAALAKAIAEVEQGAFINPEKLTVGDYLREWHANRKHSLGIRTWERYGQLIENWLVPLLGNIPLQKLTPMHLERWITTMLEAPRRDGREGKLSPTTVHHAVTVLGKALRDAVKKRIIPANPLDAVEKPRRERKEPVALSEEEARKILQAAEGTCAYTPIALALYTGARLGEILALSWEDVDLAAGCIFIRQALKRSRTGELLIDAPKTRGSRRRVEIGPETAAVLKRQKKLQAEWRLKAGPLWQDTGLVCTREDGSPINPHAMSSLFHKVAAKAGVRAGFHSLRHTHATLLLKADVNLKIVQERLGHASISITGDLYSHVKPGMQKEAAALIEQALKK